ncbi:MAG: hypothetical protein AB1597_06055 [Chloroflexota bacterium]
MADYYFDIETYSKTPSPSFNDDEIIAITYQQIDSRTGQAKNKLNILKSWESSEADILQKFHTVLSPQEKWTFVPIGCNLSFDFTSLLYRWRKAGMQVNAKNLFAEHPYIDIQPVLIMFNKGSFSGCTLEKYAGKKWSGSKIAEWYTNKDYDAIQNYIEDEVACFLKLYQFLVQKLPNVWIEYAKGAGIIV